jgi:hypothetical protein
VDGPAPWVVGLGSAAKWSGTARPLSWCHAADVAGSGGGDGGRLAASSRSSWSAMTIIVVLALVRARLEAQVAAFFIRCCPSVAVEVCATFVR